MTYNYSNSSESSWNPNSSATLSLLQRESDSFFSKYLTPYTSNEEYDFALKFRKTLFSKNVPNSDDYTYLYLAALGGLDSQNGATRYIMNYTASLLKVLDKNKAINIPNVLKDINSILSENQGLLRDIIDNNSTVTPFITELCDTYFGYVFGKRLNVKGLNYENLKGYKLPIGTTNNYNK